MSDVEIETGLGEPVAARPTKRDLVERGPEVLDDATRKVSVSSALGGVVFTDYAQVLGFAKNMSTSGYFLQKEFRGNVGACLAITSRAIAWHMDPFAVASKCYVVNDRVGWESQLVHAVVNMRAPLQHRLDVQYDGEGDERTCTVRGTFLGGDIREYISPPLAKIKGHSPLWKTDVDQQLWYFSVRAWARKWVPEVLLGVYTREELQENPNIGREVAAQPGLAGRLAATPRGEEGYQDGHAVRELDQIAPAGQTIEHEPRTGADPAAEATPIGEGEPDPGHHTRKASKRTTDRPRGKAKRTKQETRAKKADLPKRIAKPSKAERISKAENKVNLADAEIRKVTTVAGYQSYARKWIADCKDSTELFVRWTAERKLRNALGMTGDVREPLDKLVYERRRELEG